MCGIIGGVSSRDVVGILYDGLKRLEYRGYDSAGIAVIHEGKLDRRRIVGKVGVLGDSLKEAPLSGFIGIAHTRWATHGKPSVENAHPQRSGATVVVHNGIIENYLELKASLMALGYHFSSQTDTEVIVHALNEAQKSTDNFFEAFKNVKKQLKGAYSLAVMDEAHPEVLWVARQGSPLVIGVGLHENFIASDSLALLPVTQDFVFLEEGDVAQITAEGYTVWDALEHRVERPLRRVNYSLMNTERGHYRHFMLKEIFEQPGAVAACFEGRLSDEGVLSFWGLSAETIFKATHAVEFVACGTSYHAGLIAAKWCEQYAKLPARASIASELLSNDRYFLPGTLVVTISQSGETADTLAALRRLPLEACSGTLTVCNRPESALVRASDLVCLTQAGPEIGVASTKAFTSQLVGLLLLAASLARHRGHPAFEGEVVKALRQLPSLLSAILELDEAIAAIAVQFKKAKSSLFLGRGCLEAVAREGALKLKEISYIHAEAYPAGELKHGPLALVDETMPVVVLIANDELQAKMISNIEEVEARGGRVVAFVEQGVKLSAHASREVIILPPLLPLLAPIAMSLPLQLLAYHVGVLKGTDVDQPRNLAKSVTVE